MPELVAAFAPAAVVLTVSALASAFVAMALDGPDRWLGRRADPASDELPQRRVADAGGGGDLRSGDGEGGAARAIPTGRGCESRSKEGVAFYNGGLNRLGYEADVPGLHAEHPELATPEQHLCGHGW